MCSCLFFFFNFNRWFFKNKSLWHVCTYKITPLKQNSLTSWISVQIKVWPIYHLTYFHQDRKKKNTQQSLHNFDSASNCPESRLMAELAAIIILDLNISFLLTICSYRLLPAQRLLSSQVALSEMHDIISQLWLSNLDYCANKKSPESWRE